MKISKNSEGIGWQKENNIDGEDIDLTSYAKKSEIPTKTSQLTNDNGFISSIPEEYVTDDELNAKGYLTEHQDISGKADKSEIPTKLSELQNDSNFISSIPSEYVTETELEDKGYLTEHQDLSNYALKTEIPSVPTKTSQLTNDNGFITTIPSEYITESELNAKGYLTEVPSEYITETELELYQPKQDNALNTEDKTIVGAINELNSKVLTSANIYFNSSGELVVTIGDTTKTFVPKE